MKKINHFIEEHTVLCKNEENLTTIGYIANVHDIMF